MHAGISNEAAELNNPVYDYADDDHTTVNCELEGDVDDKTGVLYHSLGPSTLSSDSETKVDIRNEADGHAHCTMIDSRTSLQSEKCHYEMENGKVS